MNTTPKANYSFSLGARVVARGLMIMAKRKPLIFLWVNIFSTWFIGGGALMMYRGSTSILPLVCVITPIFGVTGLIFLASKYGFCKLLGLPRAIPWLVAMGIAMMEYLDGSHVSQPEGYYTFLIGFLIINGIATFLDFLDIYWWLDGNRAEHPDTGFFSGAY